MAETFTIEAQPRERAGKGAARADRRAGRVPGVVYGAKQEPTLITVSPSLLDRELYKPGFFTNLFEIRVDGSKAKQLAICRDVQFDPATDRPIHIDFLRVAADTEINVNIPVHFVNEEESPGLERGGVLNVIRHEIEFLCRADSIPSAIEADLTGLDINDSIHIGEVSLPEGVRPTVERDFTIATIGAPSAVKAEIAEEQAAAEAEAEEVEGEEAPAEEAEAAAEGEAEAEGEEEKEE
jgi:large subunit ribosomal protein L25